MPTELRIAYPEMKVFAHTTLTIMSGPLMPCLETIYTASFADVNLQSFYSITSKI